MFDRSLEQRYREASAQRRRLGIKIPSRHFPPANFAGIFAQFGGWVRSARRARA